MTATEIADRYTALPLRSLSFGLATARPVGKRLARSLACGSAALCPASRRAGGVDEGVDDRRHAKLERGRCEAEATGELAAVDDAGTLLG